MGEPLRQNASLLEETVELASLLQVLQLRVAANVLLVDVDVGHGALAVDLLESILELAAFGCEKSVRSDTAFATTLGNKQGGSRTKLVKLYNLVGTGKALESALGGLAVRAVALGEDNYDWNASARTSLSLQEYSLFLFATVS